jgi:hypothetical protein
LVPSYHRILVKHGLIEKTLPVSDAYKVFLTVGANPEVLHRANEGTVSCYLALVVIGMAKAIP